jgi:uncharacterized membrane protein YtjA (UPF0391 family)
MLFWPITVVVIALILGIRGFDGATGTAVEIAKILFVVSMVLILIASLIGRRNRTW